MSGVITGHFPLTLTLICIESDCETVFREGPDCCPACGNATLVYLSSLVPTGRIREEVNEIRQRWQIESRALGDVV